MKTLNIAYSSACINGNVKVVQFFLKDERLDPSSCLDKSRGSCYDAFLTAIQFGKTEVVEAILNSKKVDPSILDNAAIFSAIHNAPNASMVKLLMKDPRVNPAARNNEAIELANRFGLTDVKNELLKDYRVSVAFYGKRIAKIAAGIFALSLISSLAFPKKSKKLIFSITIPVTVSLYYLIQKISRFLGAWRAWPI